MHIQSSVYTQSPLFIEQRQAMLALVDQFRTHEETVCTTSNRQLKKFQSKNKLLPRQRLQLLLDRGSSWIELSSLAGWGMHDDDGKRKVYGTFKQKSEKGVYNQNLSNGK